MRTIPGVVYLIWAEGTDRFKIGFTADENAEIRLATMSTGSPFPLRIIAEMRGTRADEKMIHLALARFKCRRQRGHEWFALSEEATWWLLAHMGVELLEPGLIRKAIEQACAVESLVGRMTAFFSPPQNRPANQNHQNAP